MHARTCRYTQPAFNKKAGLLLVVTTFLDEENMYTELALNWNCPYVDAILFRWSLFGGIKLAFTYHGRQLPRVWAEREGDCAPPLRAVREACEGRARERAGASQR